MTRQIILSHAYFQHFQLAVELRPRHCFELALKEASPAQLKRKRNGEASTYVKCTFSSLEIRTKNSAIPSSGSGEFEVSESRDSSRVVSGGAPPRWSAPPPLLTGWFTFNDTVSAVQGAMAGQKCAVCGSPDEGDLGTRRRAPDMCRSTPHRWQANSVRAVLSGHRRLRRRG